MSTSEVPKMGKVATAPSSVWQYSWDECPWGHKMLLLTEEGIAVIGHVGRDHRGYKAWAPLPDRDKVAENSLVAR